MFESKHSSAASFWEGVLIGSAVGAMATFVLGTKKGKQLQKDMLHKCKKLGVKAKHFQEYVQHKLPMVVKKAVKKGAAKAKRTVRRAKKR